MRVDVIHEGVVLISREFSSLQVVDLNWVKFHSVYILLVDYACKSQIKIISGYLFEFWLTLSLIYFFFFFFFFFFFSEIAVYEISRTY